MQSGVEGRIAEEAIMYFLGVLRPFELSKRGVVQIRYMAEKIEVNEESIRSFFKPLYKDMLDRMFGGESAYAFDSVAGVDVNLVRKILRYILVMSDQSALPDIIRTAIPFIANLAQVEIDEVREFLFSIPPPVTVEFT